MVVYLPISGRLFMVWARWCHSISTEIRIKDRQFLKVFDEAAMKTLGDLGESVQTAVLYHIGKIEGMSPSAVLKNPLRFAEALQKIFLSGSSVLEDKIIESMCISLGISPLNIRGTFEQRIAALYTLAFSKKSGSQSADENSLVSYPLEFFCFQAN